MLNEPYYTPWYEGHDKTYSVTWHDPISGQSGELDMADRKQAVEFARMFRGNIDVKVIVSTECDWS